MTQTPKRSARVKGPDAFRTIGEAAAAIGVQPHVLRFWETKFARLQPLTRAGGRRYYRPEDVALLRTIKQLLHEDGLTIRGAQKALQRRSCAGLLDPAPEGETVRAESPAMPQAGVIDPLVRKSPSAQNPQAPLQPDLRRSLVALAAEARSVAKGGAVPHHPATD